MIASLAYFLWDAQGVGGGMDHASKPHSSLEGCDIAFVRWGVRSIFQILWHVACV